MAFVKAEVQKFLPQKPIVLTILEALNLKFGQFFKSQIYKNKN